MNGTPYEVAYSLVEELCSCGEVWGDNPRTCSECADFYYVDPDEMDESGPPK